MDDQDIPIIVNEGDEAYFFQFPLNFNSTEINQHYLLNEWPKENRLTLNFSGPVYIDVSYHRHDGFKSSYCVFSTDLRPDVEVGLLTQGCSADPVAIRPVRDDTMLRCLATVMNHKDSLNVDDQSDPVRGFVIRKKPYGRRITDYQEIHRGEYAYTVFWDEDTPVMYVVYFVARDANTTFLFPPRTNFRNVRHEHPSGESTPNVLVNLIRRNDETQHCGWILTDDWRSWRWTPDIEYFSRFDGLKQSYKEDFPDAILPGELSGLDYEYEEATRTIQRRALEVLYHPDRIQNTERYRRARRRFHGEDTVV